jgi:hypothetical protein
MSGDQGERGEYRGRTRQNLVVLGILLGLLLSGLWLFSALRAYLKVEACIEAGYRNCTPLEGPKGR